MLLNRRFTARNGALVLFTGIIAILFFHPRIGIWRDETGASNRETTRNGNKQQSLAMNNGKRTALVVASQKDDNTTWLSDYFPQWEKNVYMVDNAESKLKVPKNKGREGMAYLT